MSTTLNGTGGETSHTSQIKLISRILHYAYQEQVIEMRNEINVP